ncbi:hypothetical protein LJC25_00115 [Bacteroidales bacterium OttesenSCG-928-K03]|nr:hypothetical protein [Bacteroidales bacterium OttesenSCG-928-K03]
MTKNLRLTSLLILLLSVNFNLFGQNFDNAVVQDYNRNSISEIFIRYGDSYDSYIQKRFETYTSSNKFDINEIPLKYINAKDNRSNVKENIYMNYDRTAPVTKYLNENNVGLDVVSYIFNRDSKGKMDLNRIHERGLYTAKDTDVRLSSAKVRGLFEIEDLGHELIDNSYLIVYDFVNIRTEYDKTDKKDYYKGQVTAYLFQVQWNEKIEGMIFDSWIDEDTPADQIAEKIKAYNDIYIPVKCVLRVTTSVTNVKDKDNDFNSWLNSAMNNIGHEIQTNYSDFAVKTPITNLKPIRAKIGLKEGLKPGLRFYAYDNVMKSDGTVKKSRQGVLRVTNNIVDNRHVATGENPESQFRQIAGKKLEAGQSLVEKRDLGFSVSAGYSSTLLRGENTISIDGEDTTRILGNIGGFHLDVAYELFLNQNISNYAMIGLNVEGDALNVALSYNFGLSIRNFELLPYVGFGLDYFMAPNSPDVDTKEGNKYSAWFVQGGVRAHVNIYYPVQLFVACEWNQAIVIGETYHELAGTITEFVENDKVKDYKFRNITGLHAYGGIRICF